MDWHIGFRDEGWQSRFEYPGLSGWFASNQVTRLVKRLLQSKEKR